MENPENIEKLKKEYDESFDKSVAIIKLQREKTKIYILVGLLFILFAYALLDGYNAKKQLGYIKSQAIDRGYASMTTGGFMWKSINTKREE